METTPNGAVTRVIVTVAEAIVTVAETMTAAGSAAVAPSVPTARPAQFARMTPAASNRQAARPA
jgi:hypothetical protein